MPDLDDGSVFHAAVGTYAANGFGLHEVAGNLGEWCLDGYDPGFYRKKTGKDPVSPWSSSVIRVLRGGYWNYSPALARSASRYDDSPESRSSAYGLRPSRRITP
jgi:formylglycine-generating enzyme required for sulfatase activity